MDLVKRYNTLDLALYESASKRFEQTIKTHGDGFAIGGHALKRANERARRARLREFPSIRSPRSRGAERRSDGRGVSDLRELLVEAQAQLLQRDPAVGVPSIGSRRLRGAARSASRVGKPETSRPRAGRPLSRRRPVVRALRLDTIPEGDPLRSRKREPIQTRPRSKHCAAPGGACRIGSQASRGGSAKLRARVRRSEARGRKRVRAVVAARAGTPEEGG